jgi:hypothetical protein
MTEQDKKFIIGYRGTYSQIKKTDISEAGFQRLHKILKHHLGRYKKLCPDDIDLIRFVEWINGFQEFNPPNNNLRAIVRKIPYLIERYNIKIDSAEALIADADKTDSHGIKRMEDRIHEWEVTIHELTTLLKSPDEL